MRALLCRVCLVGALIALSPCWADAQSVREFLLPEHGTLRLDVPQPWHVHVGYPDDGLPPTIAFHPPSGNAYRIMLTPIWPSRSAGVPSRMNEMRRTVQSAADSAKSQAVETEIAVRDFKGNSGEGFYFSATDRAPRAEEFKYMTQGMLRIGELSTSFTVLTNDPAGSIASDALRMLEGARHVARPPAGGKAERHRFSLPGSSPTIILPGEHWRLTEEQRTAGDGALYYLLSSDRLKMVFSVFLDKPTSCRSDHTCLARALENSQYRQARELQRFDSGAFKAAAFFLDKPGGYPVSQAHILASAYIDGQLFDVHISKTERQRPDPRELVELLRTVEIQ